MSENAKKKRSRKQSPEELLNEAVANHESSFESWQSYREFGGQDPFWADGCNMNLIRNHIIYYKRQISELCEQNGLEIPKSWERELPPLMDIDYMAQLDKIREGAKKALEKMKGYPAYLELLAIRNVFSPKQLEKISYFNVIGYVTGLEMAIEQDDLLTQRRYCYNNYLDNFENCLKRSRELKPESFQLNLFDQISA